MNNLMTECIKDTSAQVCLLNNSYGANRMKNEYVDFKISASVCVIEFIVIELTYHRVSFKAQLM